jgi:predicted RNA-binding protein with TRAM domain
MEIPDDLLCLFSGRVERRDGSVVVEVPAEELDNGDIDVGNVYRIAILSGTESGGGEGRPQPREQPAREPPVSEGDRRTVEIEGIGDQGDGIAKVDRGYVVIVPNTDVGDVVEVEIENIFPNFAMAQVVDGEDDHDDDEVAESEADVESMDDTEPEPDTEPAVGFEVEPDEEPEPAIDFDREDDEF